MRPPMLKFEDYKEPTQELIATRRFPPAVILCELCVLICQQYTYKHESKKVLMSWSAAIRASWPAAAPRPVEAGLGPARDGWPPTSALALLVKMARRCRLRRRSFSRSALSRLSSVASVVAFRTRARRATRVAPRGHERLP